MSESTVSTPDKKPLLSDVTYTRIKRTATIILPAVITLYISLAQIWHFPNTEQTVLTISAINTALGGLIQVSKKSYYASGAHYDGIMNVTTNGDKTVASLDLKSDPNEIVNKSMVTFKVNGDTVETPIVKPGVQYER